MCVAIINTYRVVFARARSRTASLARFFTLRERKDIPLAGYNTFFSLPYISHNALLYPFIPRISRSTFRQRGFSFLSEFFFLFYFPRQAPPDATLKRTRKREKDGGMEKKRQKSPRVSTYSLYFIFCTYNITGDGGGDGRCACLVNF